MKVNNAFAIELTFKVFGQSPKEWKPTDTLRQLTRERTGNQDWSIDVLPHEPKLEGPSAVQAAQFMAGPNQAAPQATPSQLTTEALKAHTLRQQQVADGLAAGAQGGVLGLSPGVAAALTGAAGMQTQLQGQAGAAAAGQQAAAAAAAAAAAGRPQGQATAGEGGAGKSQGGAGTGAAGGPASASAATPSPALDTAVLMAHLLQSVQINATLAGLAERLGLKSLVPAAVERGVTEILSPVVERSVTIACYTTMELLMKDFALEPDEGRMRKAAHLMVSSLAGSLALVTCKDPLRVALTATLRALLTNQLPSANDAGVVEQVAAVVCNDNLDLGCAIIERAATDKAVRDVDKLLAGAYEERSKARAQGKSFVDPLALQGRFPRELPESLRPRPGVVSAMQLRVYEDFARIPRTAPPTPAPNTLPPPGAPGAAAQQQTGGQGTTPRPYGFGTDQGGGPGAESGGMGQRAPDTQALSQLPVASASYLDSYLLWQGHADAAISKVEAQGGAAP
ncbi:hypothetical protein QJQ45_028993, partial [Haematococcus lacustris]